LTVIIERKGENVSLRIEESPKEDEKFHVM
jgi:hypothetical protein